MHRINNINKNVAAIEADARQRHIFSWHDSYAVIIVTAYTVKQTLNKRKYTIANSIQIYFIDTSAIVQHPPSHTHIQNTKEMWINFGGRVSWMYECQRKIVYKVKMKGIRVVLTQLGMCEVARGQRVAFKALPSAAHRANDIFTQ